MKSMLTGLILASLLVAPARACDCGASTEEAFEIADLIADVRVVTLRQGSSAYQFWGTAKIVDGWKGVRKGKLIRLDLDKGTSCSLPLPKPGQRIRLAAKKLKDAYVPSVCLMAITKPENQFVLDNYRKIISPAGQR
jgi:hypothetical protein